MHPLATILLGVIAGLITLLGLLLCGMAGFFCATKSEARKTLIAGIVLVIMGILDIVWPLLIVVYGVLVLVGVVGFACVGAYRACKPKSDP